MADRPDEFTMGLGHIIFRQGLVAKIDVDGRIDVVAVLDCILGTVVTLTDRLKIKPFGETR